MYTPLYTEGAFAALRPTVPIRSSAPLKAIGERVRAHTSAIDPSLGFMPPRALTQALDRQLADRQVLAWVLTSLGVLGFLLAAVGLYGLLTQIVSERTREFGIRLAIGAGRAHVFRLVLRQAAWIAALGGTAGLGLGALGSRMVESHWSASPGSIRGCTQSRSRLLLPSSSSRVRGPRGRQRPTSNQLKR